MHNTLIEFFRLGFFSVFCGLVTIGIYLAEIEPLSATEEVLEVAQTTSQQPSPSSITIQKINLVGNTVFSDRQLLRVVAPYQGSTISLTELSSVRAAITDYYVQQGYISSGAAIADSDLSRGELTIRVIEGTLKDIRIEGTSYLNDNYLYSRLPSRGKPLQQQELLNSLERLRDDPLIEEVQATLQEESIGENTLRLTVKERSPFESRFALSNTFSPSIGSFGGSARFDYHLLGVGDLLDFNYTRTEGLERFDVGYEFPVNRQNTLFRIAFVDADTEIIEDPISAVDIQADYQRLLFALQQPVRLSETSDLKPTFRC